MKFSRVKTLLMLHKQVIAEFLSVEEAARIKEAFDTMDADKKGKVNIGELRIGLQKLGHQVPDPDLQILLEAVSANVQFSHSPLPKNHWIESHIEASFSLELYFTNNLWQ